MTIIQPSSKAIALLAMLCLAAAAVGVAPSLAAAQSNDSYVSVTNVTYSPETPAPGETFRVDAEIRNHAGDGGAFRINQVYATGQGTDTYFADDVGSIPPGSSTTVSLPVSFENPGTKTFTIRVLGSAPSNRGVVVQRPVTVRVVEETKPQVEVSTGTAMPGATRTVNVTVGNGKGSAVEQVAVSVASPAVEFDVQKRVTARIPAQNTTTFRFPATVDEAGRHPVDVQLAYVEDGDRRFVNRSLRADFGAPANPGEITLTGVDAVARGGTLELSATASNVGTTDVEGVVVSIGNRSDVGSADYFVGSVEGSDFSSFTLTAPVTGNVSSVPVEVRYLVDGVERTDTTSVPVRQVRVTPTTQDGGGPPVVPIVAVVGLLIVLGLVYRWRR
jgi:hypothetical protein